MIALLIAFVLSSPASPRGAACDASGFPIASVAECRASCAWWSRAEQRCRDVDVEVIGSWDPRPSPADWPTNYGGTVPSAWGAYPTEQKPTQTFTPASSTSTDFGYGP